MPGNDCTRCMARVDGTHGKYCWHVAFEKSHPGDGRPITTFPKVPKWCPGMVAYDEEE